MSAVVEVRTAKRTRVMNIQNGLPARENAGRSAHFTAQQVRHLGYYTRDKNIRDTCIFCLIVGVADPIP